MILDPPSGSKISVMTDGSDPVIVVPHASPGASRYFVGLFLLFWLGAWCFGFMHAMSEVWSGNAHGFLLFWLAGWTVGGGFAMYCLFRLFRPPVPESLRLRLNGVAYDAGVPPLQMQYGETTPKDAWKTYFPKRTRIDLDRRQLASLRLRETDTGNRLTVDAGAERLEIARSAGEIEREWLYRTLAKRYSMPSASGGAAEPQA
jgi:hypothetical protein